MGEIPHHCDKDHHGKVIDELKNNRLDCGLVVTPLKDPSIKEDVLFYEELFVYVSKKNSLFDKKYVLASEIDPNSFGCWKRALFSLPGIESL